MKTEEQIKEALEREKIIIKETEYEKWYFKAYKEALEWVLEDENELCS